MTITPPITAIFDVDQGVRGSSLSNASITLYNLSDQTRNIVYKDKYMNQEYWQIIIRGGYGDAMFELFRGNIQEAYSYKDRAEWVTKLDCFDGAYAVQNGFINETVTAGTSKGNIVSRCLESMPNLIAGVLGSPVQGETQRGTVLFGNPMDNIQNHVAGQASITGERLYILANHEVVSGNVFLIDGDNLYTTPKRRDTYLEVDTIFSPELFLNGIVEIRSKFPKYNGQYKVFGVKHNVTVSQASAGDAISTVSLYIGEKPLQEVKS